MTPSSGPWRPRNLDLVELLRPCGRIPAGTLGVVVSIYPSAALVEVVGPSQSRLLEDLITVPIEDLRILESRQALEGRQR